MVIKNVLVMLIADKSNKKLSNWIIPKPLASCSLSILLIIRPFPRPLENKSQNPLTQYESRKGLFLKKNLHRLIRPDSLCESLFEFTKEFSAYISFINHFNVFITEALHTRFVHAAKEGELYDSQYKSRANKYFFTIQTSGNESIKE